MSWIARFVTLALVAVMADATVATMRGAPAALAAVASGTALGVVVFGLFWRRPWIAASFGVLLLAAAFAFGALGGAGTGPAFTGLNPADSAALVFAGLILAGAVAACLALHNAGLRILVALLAAYALIPTAAAVQHGGLAAAFGPGPLAWTRGPYVAAEVLLPLAAVTSLLYGFIQLARKRGARGVATLVLAVALIAGSYLGAFAAGLAGLPTLVAFEHVPKAGALQSSSVAANRQSSGAGAGGQTAAEDAGAAESGPLFVPKGSGDVPVEVSAAFANIPRDPQHALGAVAALGDDLYPGALGGSAGALRSGSANSVDKAILLRDVLRVVAPNIATVFAQCSLPTAESDALIAQARAGKAHPKILMQQAGAAADSMKDPAARTRLQHWAEAWKTIIGQAQSESKKLAASLQTAGLVLPAGLPAPAALRALAAQHVWVRAHVGGNWVDLDPTIEPGTPGKTRCAPESQSATLADNLYDVLGVRVAVEDTRSGSPRRTIVLDRTMRTVDIGDHDVSFMFAEPTGMDADAVAAASPPAGALTFTPLLRVGDERITGAPIVLPSPVSSSIGKAISGRVGSVLSALGTAAPTPSPVPTPTLPTVTGLWIELSVASPAGLTTHVESPIFDRIGYVARAAHAVPTALPVQPDAGDYRSMQTVWNIAVSAGHAVSGGGPANVTSGSTAPAISSALSRLNGAYYALRRAIMDDARGTSVDVAAAKPGISVIAMANDGSLISDIASDDAIPLTTDEARPLWAASAVLAERELLNGDVPVSGVGAANDALGAFDVATTLGTRIVALRPGGAVQASAAIPDEARARMSAYLARGASLLEPVPEVAQAGGPPYAFWIVDPASGTLRDENAFGRHGDLVEDPAVTEEVAVKPVPKWRILACKIAAAVMIAVTQDSSAAEGKTVTDAIEAVKKAEEEEGGCGG
jgi:hypothetical protein